MNKNKNFWKNLWKAIFTFLLFYYSSLLQFIPILIFHIDLENLNGSTTVMLSAFSNLILIFILILLYRKELVKEWKSFKEKFVDNIDIGIKYWLCGLFAMFCFNIILNFVLQAGQSNNEKAVQSMIAAFPWLMVLNAGVFAPFIEEVVFRKCFKNIFHNKWIFILSSGFVFGLMHVITSFTNLTDLLFLFPYASLGISFAAMYSKTDTVFTSMSMHMFHNTVLVLMSIFM